MTRYFEFYNQRRLHQSLGYRTPQQMIHGAEVELMDLGGSIMIVPRETSETINRLHANFDAMREELISADVTLKDMMSAL